MPEPLVRISTGVVIPNWDMSSKTDGLLLGTAPEGFGPSFQWLSDRGAGNIIDSWPGLGIKSDLSTPPPFHSSGRCYKVALKNGVTSNLNRIIETPRSPIGMTLGGEQMVVGNEYLYTLAVYFLGEKPAGSTVATGDYRLELWAEDAVSLRQKAILGHNVAGSEFDDGTWATDKRWHWLTATGTLDGTGWTGSSSLSTNPDRLFVRIIAKVNGTSSFTSISLARIVVSTLGPVEAPASGVTCGRGSLVGAFGAPYTNYYEISRPLELDGSGPAVPERFGALSRVNGALRYRETAGGVEKRTWRGRWDQLTDTDREKLDRLSRHQGGFASDFGTAVGKPRPLVLIWNQVEEQDAVGNPSYHYVLMSRPAYSDYARPQGWLTQSRSLQRYNAEVEFMEL